MRWKNKKGVDGTVRRRQMKKRNKIIATVAALVAIMCAAVGIWQYMEIKNAGEQYEAIKESVKKDREEVQENEKQAPDIPINFETLIQENPDVYAWITIPGTAVDYPILQNTEDNDYYLTHTIDGVESPEGAIYTENYNDKNFEDTNTVIYGHDMKNGSMFQSLHNYMDRTFFDEYREIIVYTPDAVRHYKIFAAYLYDDRHLLQSFDFSNERVYRAYLDNIFSIRDMNACIDTSVEIDTEDKIITLSTCYGNQPDKRYLVQAVLETIEK